MPKILTIFHRPLFGGPTEQRYTYPELLPEGPGSTNLSDARATEEPLVSVAGSSGDHVKHGGMAARPAIVADCGCTLEDQREVQKILWNSAKEANGSCIDLSTPPRTPRAFCGEGPEDESAVQEILWNAAKSLSGSMFDISSSPEPSPGPARKKTKPDSETDEFEEENVFGFSPDLNAP